MNSPETTNSIGLTTAEVAAVREPLSKAALLPSKVYESAEIFKLERERIFAKSWLPVCHISQLSEPRSYVTRHLIGEPIIALRDKEGEIKVMSNVCRHRYTTILQGNGELSGNRFSCPYHGWTYGLNGKLLAAPFMDEAEDFNRKEISLPVFKHEVWQGFLFVNFDENTGLLADEYKGIVPEIGPYNFEDFQAVELTRYTNKWNWKVSLENFSEAYHQPWVHPESADKSFPAALAVYKDSTGPYSVFDLRQPDNGILRTMFDPVEGLDDKTKRVVRVFNAYPYMHALVDPSTPMFLDFNIINENEHELVWTLLLPKDRENPKEDAENFLSFIAPIIAEDTDICVGLAKGVQSRFSKQGRLSHMEKPIHQFHNWWLDKMLVEKD